MADKVKAVVTGLDTYVYVEDGVTKMVDRGNPLEVSQAEFDRIPGALAKARSKQAKDGEDVTPAGFPRTHEELDALAEKNDVQFDQHVRTVNEKVQALEQAGVTP